MVKDYNEMSSNKKIEEEKKRIRVNCLALEILYCMKENDISPTNKYVRYFICLGNEKIEMKYAYNYVKKNVNYIDDEILDSLNSCWRIRKKLKKSE